MKRLPDDLPVELLEGIMTTRAIRRYTDQPVSEDEILTCLRAAQQAPSGGNAQPWQYLVITDDSIRREVGRIYRAAYERWEAAQRAAMPEFRDRESERQFERGLELSSFLAEHLEDASALVLFLMPKVSIAPSDSEGIVDIGPLYASVYPAVQNFLLAARGLGIGTVLTTVWWSRQDEIRQLTQVPDRFEIVALVPMGRPQGRFGVAPRKPVEAVTHWNHYGNRH